MKSYTITVNGNVYDVTVEEGHAKTAPAATVAPKVVSPVTAQAQAPAAPTPEPTPAPTVAPAGSAGAFKITAGAAGKVFKIESSVGQAVKKGDTVLIIEAMKMEIPVVAPQDGVVASIDVTAGSDIESGQVLATLN